MAHRVMRWPVERRLGLLLQTPAHRVVRIMQVTQAQWMAADALNSAHMPTRALRERGVVSREFALAD